MKLRKLLCALLAALTVTGALASCGTGTETPEETQGNGDAATDAATEGETVDPAEAALSALEGNVDWGGGDFTVLYVNDIAGYTEEVEAEKEAGNQTSSAVINDAVYERNSLLEDRCNLIFNLAPSPSGSIQSAVQNEVSTQTGDFQLIIQTTSGTASMATSAMLYNYIDLMIDYEQPWWDSGTLNFALDGKVFFMNGAHNIVDDDVTFVMMFNKTLQDQYKVPDPYTTVRNKEWTLDHFNTIIQNIATDNGDGTWDEKDTYGFTTPGSIGNTFFYGAGLQYVANDRDMAMPELMLDDTGMEKAMQVLDKALQIVHANNATYMAAQGNEILARDVFIENRSLFYVEAASYLRALNQTMEGDYGVVPIPKFNKEQEHYLTWTHSIGSTLSMPTSVHNNADKLEGVLETYVVLSYQLVKPAYYDTMLTSRNVRDPESAEMLDIIFQNRTYDMAMYFNSLDMAALFETCVKENSDAFSSKYAGVSQRFDRNIQSILRKLQRG